MSAGHVGSFKPPTARLHGRNRQERPRETFSEWSTGFPKLLSAPHKNDDALAERTGLCRAQPPKSVSSRSSYPAHFERTEDDSHRSILSLQGSRLSENDRPTQSEGERLDRRRQPIQRSKTLGSQKFGAIRLPGREIAQSGTEYDNH
jgi:hypothetical protein